MSSHNFGKTVEHLSNNFPDESFAVVSSLVREEKDPLPLLSAIHALGHIGKPQAVPLVIEHGLHPKQDVRFAVACALGNFADDPSAIELCWRSHKTLMTMSAIGQRLE